MATERAGTRMTETAADRPGLPASPIRRWISANLPDADLTGPWAPEIISGGLSNITCRLRLPSGNLILRRPPLGPLLPRAHDVAREYRVLSALARTAVPVPAPLGLCTDLDVIGAPFYLTPEVPGDVLRTAQATAELSPAERAALGRDLAGVLAALHALDPDAIGLGDYGRREGYCRRQIVTWGAQWQRSCRRELPEMDLLLAALAERAPPDSRSSIVHGDYRLDNTIVDREAGPRITAVLDWELSTLGDPLADLGLSMTYWHDIGDDERGCIPVAAGITAWPGFPTARGFAESYAARSGLALRNMEFYLALGAMKLAVILEGVHARYLIGRTVGEGYDTAGAAVPVLIARGLRQLTTPFT